jgi:hypothetical protein
MQWKLVHLTASGPPTVLELDGVGVVRLMDRVGGTWFAVLNYHLDEDQQVRRDCTSYEAGRRGAELWAQRHMARLEREAAAKRERWARLPVAAGEDGRPRLTVEQMAEERARIAASIAVVPRRPRRRR